MSARQKPLPALELDLHSGLPVYLQIMRQVEKHAATGRLRVGDQLPTVRGLALQLGVNFNTVARAYGLLNQAGVVSAQQGRGTFVLDQAARRKASSTTLQALTAEYIAQARRHNFTAAQIAAALARRLKLGVPASRAGDNHE